MAKRYNFTAKARVYGIDDEIGELVTVRSWVQADSKADAKETLQECILDILDEQGLVDFQVQRALIESVEWSA